MDDHMIYNIAAYTTGCLLLFAYLLLHIREDDDVTVGDALLTFVVAFVPLLNILIVGAVMRRRFSASGADFSDRVLIPRKRK